MVFLPEEREGLEGGDWRRLRHLHGTGTGTISSLWLWCSFLLPWSMDLDSSAQPLGPAVFRARHRIRTRAEFEAVFEAKIRKSYGPITVFVLATGRNEHRLGLSVGRKVGHAVVRGRFKRMMREVFRLYRGRLPVIDGGGHYDIVVTTRRHEILGLEAYARLFVQAVEAAHRVHEKRTKQAAGGQKDE